MKTHSTLFFGSSGFAVLAAVGCGLLSPVSTGLAASGATATSLVEEDFSAVVLTEAATLNDLVRRLPILSRAHEEDLAGLSAIQETMLLHERRMRGEGLPGDFPARFSDLYSSIVTAIVDDRVTMAYGRELLTLHRQLIDRACGWQARGARDADYAALILEAIAEVKTELLSQSEPLAVVPDCVRTPVVKGHLLWIEELLVADCHCRVLSRGESGALRLMAQRIERFSGYYKRDLHLTRIERANLHERLIELNRELIDALRR